MSIRTLLHARARASASAAGTVNPQLAAAIEENIRAVANLRAAAERSKTREERLADLITRSAGSMAFVYAHTAWFIVWMVVNVGEDPLLGFDPYPFGLLTMIVSLEAIFLSTFVMISQNRMSEASDRRADLDLQIDMLSEYEVTRLLRLVDAIAARLGVEGARDPELDELEARVQPGAVMAKIEEREAADRTEAERG